MNKIKERKSGDYIFSALVIVSFFILFLLIDDDFTKPDIFFLSRYIMRCYAADAALSGYVCEYPYTDKLEIDTWGRVSGTSDISTYDNNKGTNVKIPKIIVKKITTIEPPKMKYVFAR